ncbi:MAG: sulfurtransferase TusA family protein [Candidatus Eisenbacteria bacterium]
MEDSAGPEPAPRDRLWEGLPPVWSFESRFDGGDTGCGEMILDLRTHFRSLPGGTRVAIRALDEGAPVEIPAWCRVTGHRLLEARHPFYLTQSKE